MTERRAHTTCAGCGRVVWLADVDGSRRCCFCQTPKGTEKRSAAKAQERDGDGGD